LNVLSNLLKEANKSSSAEAQEALPGCMKVIGALCSRVKIDDSIDITPFLVNSLKSGDRKADALKTILSLASDHKSAKKLIDGGLIPYIQDLLNDDDLACDAFKALTILSLIPSGAKAIDACDGLEKVLNWMDVNMVGSSPEQMANAMKLIDNLVKAGCKASSNEYLVACVQQALPMMGDEPNPELVAAALSVVENVVQSDSDLLSSKYVLDFVANATRLIASNDKYMKQGAVHSLLGLINATTEASPAAISAYEAVDLKGEVMAILDHVVIDSAISERCGMVLASLGVDSSEVQAKMDEIAALLSEVEGDLENSEALANLKKTMIELKKYAMIDGTLTDESAEVLAQYLQRALDVANTIGDVDGIVELSSCVGVLSKFNISDATIEALQETLAQVSRPLRRGRKA